ncbi:MAG TPA: ATP-binding protein, partial [Actinomycetota bacterium]|nr:ATP-binding protein [Actinomycetota bacterium]
LPGEVAAVGFLVSVVALLTQMRAYRHSNEDRTRLEGTLSTVSHELRTPLTMIQGFAELLLTRKVNDETQTGALTQIHDSSKRVTRIIEGLLSISRIEAGLTEPNLEALDIRPIILEAAATIEADQHLLSVDVDADTPLLGDHDMLLQALTNLVVNAAKYSAPGTEVKVEGRRSGSLVSISVSDCGSGIPSKEIPRLFEKHYRATSAVAARIPGTGLGLYITKNLVEMQNGHIRVESKPGVGSTFTISLPVAEQT